MTNSSQLTDDTFVFGTPLARVPALSIIHTALNHMLPPAPDLGLSLSEPRDDASEFRLF
jgi:hypothetical protein